jgi:hypothetical protein
MQRWYYHQDKLGSLLMQPLATPFAIALGFFLSGPLLAVAQTTLAPAADTARGPSNLERQQEPQPAASAAKTPEAPALATTEYPAQRAGVFIRDSDWVSLPSAVPAQNRVKHGFAPAITYGLAPAAIVSEYAGLHAQAQVKPGQPVICICRMISIPGEPVLVTLHAVPKKSLRELRGGNLHIASRTEQAEKTDLIPTAVAHPEDTVWLVQPQQALPPGEYALMLGTQNLAIFPFTVTAESPAVPPPPKN